MLALCVVERVNDSMLSRNLFLFVSYSLFHSVVHFVAGFLHRPSSIKYPMSRMKFPTNEFSKWRRESDR
jgi:hypothetical protein